MLILSASKVILINTNKRIDKKKIINMSYIRLMMIIKYINEKQYFLNVSIMT